jgi:glutamyl-tRNA synthetase
LPLVRKEWEAQNLPAISEETLTKLIELARERATLIPELIEAVRFYHERPQLPLPENLRPKLNPIVLEHLPTLREALATQAAWDASTVEATLKTWVAALSIGVGKVLPTLRLILTGQDAGPSLYAIMAILGKEEVQARIHTFLQSHGLLNRV